MKLRTHRWPLAIALGLALVLVSGSPVAQDTGLTVRAAWVTRWALRSAGDVKTLFARLADLGVNTVFLQVRGAGDAFYRSSYEPWSDLLTGTLGKDPGWDPLKVAVREGHRLGLEVHAWVNVFTAFQTTDSGQPPAITDPLHPMLAHPDWVARNRAGTPMPILKSATADNYAFFSPTKKAVQDHVKHVINEIVGKYRVDGIHLDYVRFPDSSYSYDTESRVAYLKAELREGLSFAQWRRRELGRFVGDVRRSVGMVRPGTAVSAAVWQVIDAGRTTYYQDGVDWMRRGYVDFLVPMIYSVSVASFESRLKAYADSVGGSSVVAGIGAYLEGFDGAALVGELDAATALHAGGIAVFNSDYALAYGDVLRTYFGVTAASDSAGR
jgi:uncharacterized lipoprotein YddW (UPF0748 family)